MTHTRTHTYIHVQQGNSNKALDNYRLNDSHSQQIYLHFSCLSGSESCRFLRSSPSSNVLCPLSRQDPCSFSCPVSLYNLPDIYTLIWGRLGQQQVQPILHLKMAPRSFTSINTFNVAKKFVYFVNKMYLLKLYSCLNVSLINISILYYITLMFCTRSLKVNIRTNVVFFKIIMKWYILGFKLIKYWKKKHCNHIM